MKIFAMHAKVNPAQQGLAEASHARRPEYWPGNEPWPANDGPIVGNTDELPPIYVLRSGRAVRGFFKPFCLSTGLWSDPGPHGAPACRHFDGLSIGERRETILNMSAARQERLAELGITPEMPVINIIGGKICPERSVIHSEGEVPECVSKGAKGPYLRWEGSECSIGGVWGHCSHGLGRGTCAFCRDPSARDSSKGLGVVERSRTLLSQIFAKLDFHLEPPRGGDRRQFQAIIVVGAVVIYCVARNNPASADDADAEMVLRDPRFANPTLYTSLPNPPHRRRPGPRQLVVKGRPVGGELNA